LLGLLLLADPASGGGEARHAGRIHSLAPAEGVLVIEEVVSDGATEFVHVRVRDAEVVRVWRDRADPWQWRERPTWLYRLPAGTFVVIIGRQEASGAITARRIEVPEVADR
jgi:hypothetical protein